MWMAEQGAGWAAILESDDMVARLDIGNTFTNRLDNTGTLVT
jgi:hypothetical protein